MAVVVWLRSVRQQTQNYTCVNVCHVCCQALLEEWRSELARKPLAMSEKEACAVLGVPQEEGQGQTQEGPLSEDALKAAYRYVC